ncbi:helix-turn-helix transcriptional regulator [Pseudoteredinibacter isoporae]|uniref:AraC-like DNA-binding protein n=1 Tax=Pseudoteredinibacter isoporae TaxID=570281 RepID=A0A7X0JTW7_9GAMM|nr:AraC family transcriptional regulator [Pseudoteredinibacter isoporae]MBB6521256.1 AraC-like DNA-binding protein [Pseudoteredinibacter isoporae]NHO86814.1 helix-turn-helix transcriptional regulator [Pseudoteredinibacter isoporae]NIB24734.1 helix-turn-helix transcriptional regulator [Pseudoteredinibacter isoporae]
MSDTELGACELPPHTKTFRNAAYSEWVQLKNNYPRFVNYRNSKTESGYEELYRLQAGFYLRILNLKVLQHSTVPLKFAGQHLIIALKLRGTNKLSSAGGEELFLSASTAGIYYFDEDALLEDSSEKDDYLMVMLVIDVEQLGQAPLSFEADSMPRMLHPILNGVEKRLEFSYHFGPDILSAAEAVVGRRVRQEHLSLYLRSKAVELLCLVFQDISLLEANYQLKQIPEQDIERLNQVKLYIDDNLQDILPVADMAKRFQLSESRLKSGFSSLFGMSIRQYLLGLRMQRSQEMLAENRLNIDVIADQLGYRHTSNFISAFKRHFGMTPKAYQTRVLTKFMGADPKS